MSIKDLIRFSVFRDPGCSGNAHVQGTLALGTVEFLNRECGDTEEKIKNKVTDIIMEMIHREFHENLDKLNRVIKEEGRLSNPVSDLPKALEGLNSVACYNPSKEGWQPIETAPQEEPIDVWVSNGKTGYRMTDVEIIECHRDMLLDTGIQREKLVLCDYKGNPIEKLGHYYPGNGDPTTLIPYKIDKTFGLFEPEKLTHWRSIPESPEVKG